MVHPTEPLGEQTDVHAARRCCPQEPAHTHHAGRCQAWKIIKIICGEQEKQAPGAYNALCSRSPQAWLVHPLVHPADFREVNALPQKPPLSTVALQKSCREKQ